MLASRAPPSVPLGLSLAVVGLLTACPPSPPGPFPPDPFPDDGGTVLIERDPACTLTGTLTIGLGESDGLDDFRPLPAGQAPFIHHGSQGGIHVILGASVVNPATGFPGLQVRFILDAQVCTTNGCQQQVMGQYTTVVNQDRYIALPGGSIAVTGFFILLKDWPQNSTRRVIAEVYDRCGRMGTTMTQVSAGTP
jgi:hypothetical protein